MYNTLNKIFEIHKVETLNELKKVLEDKLVNERAGRTAFRVFLNYLENKELLDEDILIKLRRKIYKCIL